MTMPRGKATEISRGSAAPPPTPAEEAEVLLAAGQRIAGYRIESVIGRGGMGTVYRALQLSMRRPVALKVLAARYARDPGFVARFRREAQAAGRLHHPHLVIVHDAGEADGFVYLSMELVEGRSLAAILAERGRLPPEEVLAIARQALDALAYAHEQGVIHRDIKPDNLLLSTSGQLKIADLGLSRLVVQEGSSSYATHPGAFLGTPHYAAPEQARDARVADARSDLYALGATLYHLACGRPPFDGPTAMAVLLAAQTQPLVWPDDGPPGPLRGLIARLMARDPNERPPHAAAALAEVERAEFALRARHAPRRRARWLPLLVLLVIIAGTVLIVLAVRRARAQGLQREGLVQVAYVQHLVYEHRYAQALEHVQDIERRFPDAQVRSAAAQARQTVIAAWDAWALPRVAEVESAVLAHLAAGRFREARDALRAVPESWHSPAAEARLESLQQAWEDAVTREAERRPESPAPGLLHEWRGRALAPWQALTADPPSALIVSGEKLRFRGAGRAELPAIASGPRVYALRMRWVGAGSGSWQLAGGESAFVVEAGGARVDGREVLAESDGSVQVLLQRRRGSWQLAVRTAQGWHSLDLPAEAGMQWKLENSEVEAQVLTRRPPRPGDTGR